MRRARVMTRTEAYQHAIRNHAHLENEDLERVFEDAIQEARDYTMAIAPHYAADCGLLFNPTSLGRTAVVFMSAEMRRRGMIN